MIFERFIEHFALVVSLLLVGFNSFGSTEIPACPRQLDSQQHTPPQADSSARPRGRPKSSERIENLKLKIAEASPTDILVQLLHSQQSDWAWLRERINKIQVQLESAANSLASHYWILAFPQEIRERLILAMAPHPDLQIPIAIQQLSYQMRGLILSPEIVLTSKILRFPDLTIADVHRFHDLEGLPARQRKSFSQNIQEVDSLIYETVVPLNNPRKVFHVMAQHKTLNHWFVILTQGRDERVGKYWLQLFSAPVRQVLIQSKHYSITPEMEKLSEKLKNDKLSIEGAMSLSAIEKQNTDRDVKNTETVIPKKLEKNESKKSEGMAHKDESQPNRLRQIRNWLLNSTFSAIKANLMTKKTFMYFELQNLRSKSPQWFEQLGADSSLIVLRTGVFKLTKAEQEFLKQFDVATNPE